MSNWVLPSVWEGVLSQWLLRFPGTFQARTARGLFRVLSLHFLLIKAHHELGRLIVRKKCLRIDLSGSVIPMTKLEDRVSY